MIHIVFFVSFIHITFYSLGLGWLVVVFLNFSGGLFVFKLATGIVLRFLRFLRDEIIIIVIIIIVGKRGLGGVKNVQLINNWMSCSGC